MRRLISTAVFAAAFIFATESAFADVEVINNGGCGGCSNIAESHKPDGTPVYTCTGNGDITCSGSVIDENTGNPYALVVYAGDQIAAGVDSGSYTGPESDWGGATATVTWTASPQDKCSQPPYIIDEALATY